jgi:preprotein translocase subunit SecA
MLEVEVQEHVAMALAEPEGPWKLLAWLEETQPTLNLDSPNPYPSYMLKLLLDELEGIIDPVDLHQALLDLAAEAMKAQHSHLSRAIQEQLDRAVERLDEQVRSRIELAEMAIDGALIEAEETGSSIGARQLFQAVEHAAGMKIESDDASAAQVASDPDGFRERIPELVEASLGMRVWVGMVQGVERRIGQTLNLSQGLPVPIDWDAASDTLQTRLEEVWTDKIQSALDEINRDLGVALGKAQSVDQAEAARLLVRISYSQQTVFDRRTHQKVSAVTPRLSYAFSAADLLDQDEPEAVSQDVLEHLAGARDTLVASLGAAELRRVAGSGIEALDERLKRNLKRGLGEGVFAETAGQGPIAALDEARRGEVAEIVGQAILTEAYRGVILSVGDRLWVDYLTEMEALRTSIGLEAYGQRDPLVQYKSRAFDMFQALLASIRSGVVSRLFRTQPVAQAQAVAAPPASAARPQTASRPAQSSGNGSSKRRRRKRRRH